MRSGKFFMISTVFALISAGLIMSHAAWASAAKWEASGQRDKKGLRHAYISLKQGAYNLGLSCRQGGKPYLHMVLIGKNFPNLYAADDVEAVLTFRFDLPGGVTHKNAVKAWYFGPDQAWTGQFPVDTNILNSFAHAESMTLMNPKGQTVVSFSMTGSAAAVQMVRKQCGVGIR